MSTQPLVEFTDSELMETLAAVERINPTLFETYALVVMSSMPRQKYLGYIQSVEHERSRKGL